MRQKLIISSIFVSILFLSTGWFLINGMQPEILPVGTALPEINYKTKTGKKRLINESNLPTLITLFNRDCEHCQYELHEIIEKRENLKEFKLIFLTFDPEIFQANYPEKWEIPFDGINTEWGIVDENEFIELFGTGAVPSLFLFDQNGKLNRKIIGETKLEFLLADFHSHTNN